MLTIFSLFSLQNGKISHEKRRWKIERFLKNKFFLPDLTYLGTIYTVLYESRKQTFIGDLSGIRTHNLLLTSSDISMTCLVEYVSQTPLTLPPSASPRGYFSSWYGKISNSRLTSMWEIFCLVEEQSRIRSNNSKKCISKPNRDSMNPGILCLMYN